VVLRACPFSCVISFLTFLKHRTSACHPLLVTHGPVFTYYLFSLIGKPAVSCPSTEARPASTGISSSRTLKKIGVREDLSYTFLKERQTEE